MRISILIIMLIQVSFAPFAFAINPYWLGGIGVVAFAAYKGHKTIRTPQQFTPSLDNLNVLLLSPMQEVNIPNAKTIRDVVRDIEQKKIKDGDILRVNKNSGPTFWRISKNLTASDEYGDGLFIYSRGNSDRTIEMIDNAIGSIGTPRNGGGILEAYKYIKDNIINGPCITFDFPDTRGTLSFGQHNEEECFRMVYDEVIRNNPNKKIICIGKCRGALIDASKSFKNLSLLIAESPLLSFKKATQRMEKSYTPWLPYSGSFMYHFFSYLLPAYNPEADTLLEKIQHIPIHIPILIGHLKNDEVISDQAIEQALQKLENREHLYLTVVNDTTKKIWHGKLDETKPFQQVCNAFLAAHNYIHDASLAQEGQSLLEKARDNAHCTSQEWFVAQSP